MIQGPSELGDVVVAQFEGAWAWVIVVVTVDFYVKFNQVPETLSWGDERSVDVDIEQAFDGQDLQRFLGLGQWCRNLSGGSAGL